MTWIMIIILYFGPGTFVPLVAEFDTEQACEVALNGIVTGGPNRIAVVAQCLPSK